MFWTILLYSKCKAEQYLFCVFQGPSSSPLHKPLTTKSKTNTSRSTALKGVDPKLAQLVLDEVLEGGSPVQWEDIAGQEVSLIIAVN